MAQVINYFGDPRGQLRKDYEAHQRLFHAQPISARQFLQSQAMQIADALLRRLPEVRFELPEKVINPQNGSQPLDVPIEQRLQVIGGPLSHLTHTDHQKKLDQRLAELEKSHLDRIALCGLLMRHAIALHIVHNLLPAGRSVVYNTLDGEEVPTIPTSEPLQRISAITTEMDAIVENGEGESKRGELQSPYTPAAQHFYLPQWVALDEKDNLLTRSVKEAEAYLASMQNYIDMLHLAASLAPYLAADPVFQEKRYGVLGQLINQGRALARYQTRQIIIIIKRRAAEDDLNRGLGINLPFFDDQELKTKIRQIEIIPAGRIMFVPAFVVLSIRREQSRIAQEMYLNASTRKHLFEGLKTLESAFS